VLLKWILFLLVAWSIGLFLLFNMKFTIDVGALNKPIKTETAINKTALLLRKAALRRYHHTHQQEHTTKQHTHN
jgi:hypothetical protein